MCSRKFLLCTYHALFVAHQIYPARFELQPQYLHWAMEQGEGGGEGGCRRVNGKLNGRADLPMPELRCKLPQAVANIERAQFWGHVLQIPGMQVVKSDVYDSLGIAMPGCLNGKGTSRENKDKNVNNTPKLAPKNAKTNEIEKALKDGIEWVLKHRKSLYEVCYVPSLNEEGEEELVPLDLHLKDILHASEHNDTAKVIWKIIARSKLSLRDNKTDEVYRYGRKKRY